MLIFMICLVIFSSSNGCILVFPFLLSVLIFYCHKFVLFIISDFYVYILVSFFSMTII